VIPIPVLHAKLLDYKISQNFVTVSYKKNSVKSKELVIYYQNWIKLCRKEHLK
jgi:hypothetical protein